MSKKYLMGIDMGNSGIRIGIFDEDGNYSGGAAKNLVPKSPKPGQRIVDPTEFSDAVFGLIHTSIENTGVNPTDIAGISSCTCGNRYAGIDENGNYPFGIIDMSDARAFAKYDELFAILAKAGISLDDFISITSSGPVPFDSLLLTLKETEPEKFDTVKKWSITHYAIVMQSLCGNFVEVKDLMNSSGLYDMYNQCISEKFCKVFGIKPDSMATPYPPGVFIGEVTQEAAAKTGLTVGTKVFGGGHDTTTQMTAMGCINEKDILIALGTWGVIMRYSRKALHKPGILDNNFDENGWRHMLCVAGIGAMINWMRETFAELLDPVSEKLGLDPYDYMSECVGKSPIGANGIRCTPQIIGDISNRKLRCNFINISIGSCMNDLIRASYEGIACEMARNIFAMEEATGVITGRILVVGGGSKSKVLLQMIADIIGRTMTLSEISPDLTGIKGSAMIAGIGAGVYKSITDAVAKTVKNIDACKPIPENVERYKNIYTTYCEVYSNLSKYVCTHEL
jgi:xylulokinase